METKLAIRTWPWIFLLISVLLIPFPFYFLNGLAGLADSIFGGVIQWVGKPMFSEVRNWQITSDSTAMYLLVVILFIFSFTISFVLTFSKFWINNLEKILSLFRILLVFYLSLILMKYGLDKIFKTQFYLPEPNTLYTPLGMIDRDLLYWSAMGSSRGYNIFMGTIELMAAVLLWVKRTRVAGLFLSVVILIQVVAVNFAFDISVKLFSIFLLMTGLFLFAPHIRRIYSAFFTQVSIPSTGFAEKRFKLRHPHAIKLIVIALMLGEGLGPYFGSGNFNDDRLARPPLHGAYEVTKMVSGNDTLSGKLLPVRRFFFHRNGYLVWQDAQDRMQDFAITYDLSGPRLRVADYSLNETLMSYEIKPADSALTLRKISAGSRLELTGKQLDWRSLPLLRESFHWTIEE